MTNLICMSTLIINVTGLPFNDADYKVLKHAAKTCREDKRYEAQPCLKMLVIKPEQVYNVICGPKQEKIDDV